MTASEHIITLLTHGPLSAKELAKAMNANLNTVKNLCFKLAANSVIYTKGKKPREGRQGHMESIYAIGKRVLVSPKGYVAAPLPCDPFSSNEMDYGTMREYVWSEVESEALSIGYVAGDYLTKLPKTLE